MHDTQDTITQERYNELRDCEAYWRNKAIEALMKSGARGKYQIYRARANYIYEIKTVDCPF